MKRAIALLSCSSMLLGCHVAPEPPKEPVPTAVAPSESASKPAVTVLARGRGETTEWSPCAAAGRHLFCNRGGRWFGAPAGEDVVVRIDVEGAPPRVFDQRELTRDAPEWQPRLVSDGAHVYWITKNRVERLPAGDGPPEVVHQFEQPEEPMRPEGLAIVEGELWEQFVARWGSEGLGLTSIVRSRLGDPQRVEVARMISAAPTERNFFAGPYARVWMPTGPAQLAVSRGVGTDGRLEKPDFIQLDPTTPESALRGTANVLLAFRGKDMFYIVPERDGYVVYGATVGADRVRRLYAAKDLAEELPTQQTIGSIVVDDTYVYYLDPDWQNETHPGVRLLRLEHSAEPEAAKPVSLGVVQEAGTLWIHGGRVHMVGFISGDVVRFEGIVQP